MLRRKSIYVFAVALVTGILPEMPLIEVIFLMRERHNQLVEVPPPTCWGDYNAARGLSPGVILDFRSGTVVSTVLSSSRFLPEQKERVRKQHGAPGPVRHLFVRGFAVFVQQHVVAGA